MKIYLFLIVFLLFSILITAQQDYNNPLTRSIADRLYCLVSGCTIEGNIIVTGNLTIFGNINNVTNVNVNGSMLPSLDDTFDIGSILRRWKDGFFSNEVTALTFIGELKDGFRNANFTTQYDLRTDRWQLLNLTNGLLNAGNINAVNINISNDLNVEGIIVTKNITSPFINKSYIFFERDGSVGIMLN